MDKLAKALAKLSTKEQASVKAILIKLKSGNYAELDFKKLAGHDDIYRIRKGHLRLIFRQVGPTINILAIERRSDNGLGSGLEL